MRHRIVHLFNFSYIYIAALFLGMHAAFTIYINSTYLEQDFTGTGLTLLYATGSLLTLLTLIYVPELMRTFGAYGLFCAGILLEIIALFGLAYSSTIVYIGMFFIIHQMLPPLLFFFLDVFLEGAISTEKVTGRIRSNYLTVINFAYLLSPLVVGTFITLYSYRFVYLLSGTIVTFLLLIVIEFFRKQKTHRFREVDFSDSVRKFSYRQGLTTVFTLSFLLSCFYALMVIYTSIYLRFTIGFGWDTIGALFTIMLVPFVLFEAPLGRIFDKFHNEQDVIIVGFLLMALATFIIFYSQTSNLIAWAIILFISRTGASFVEIGTDYSFFKRVNDRDAGLISVFRTTSSLSYIVSPLIGAIVVSQFSVRYVFILVSFLMIIGMLTAFKLNRLPRKVEIS